MPTIRIAADGRRIEAEPGRPLLDVLQDAAVAVATECGGSGRCGLCLLHVVSGGELLARPSRIEREIVGGAGRLACQAEIVGEGEVVIDVPDPHEMLLRGVGTSAG